MKRKICALVMCGALFVAMMPSTVLADVEDDSTQTEEVTGNAEEESISTDQLYLGDDSSYVVEIGSDDAEEIVIEDGAEDAAYFNAVEDESGEVSVLKESADVEEDAEAEEAEEEDKVFTAASNGITVEVTAPAGALPEDAELVVERFVRDSEEYKDAAEAIDHDLDDANMAAVDISFVADGQEVEPTEAVKVSMDVSAILPEDADVGSLEVQHLVENDYSDEVDAVVIANDTDYTLGTIDKEKAVAEFEVSSFSVFTITWDDGTGTTIEVHVYSMNGTSIDEELDVESYTSTSSVITISDLVSHLEQNASYTNTYTYRYATVVYETQQGGGYSATTIGGQDNSVSSISKSGTTYTVTTSSGTTTVTDPAAIVIHLYYSIPEVTLATEDPYAETVEFTTSSNYFVGDTSTATYTWALSDDNLGTLTHPTSGQATFKWDSEVAQSGDKVTVTVTMTVGEETASDTYTLIYGDDPITFTVYAQDGTTPQENARVALVDASGNTVATGTTGADGTVTLYAPAGEYTVGVTYVYLVSEAGGGSTSRATAETTITVSDDETATGSVTLGTAITSGPGGDTSGSYSGGSAPYYYEHIDVKVAAAETSESNVSITDLDAVYVYDKYGNLLYVSDDINANPGTTDYNVLFDINGDEDQHSIVVSSEDTIVLVYEVKDNSTGETSTYTVSYGSGETYPGDEYYPATAVNAYQLYNILYNANYTSQEAFEAAWVPGLTGYNEAGISISGYSYTIIADYLCDTRDTTGQAGLDFVIYVQELDVAQHDYDFRVAKTVENVPDTLGSEDIENFTFILQELDKVQDDGDYTEAIWSTEEGNVLSTDTDKISSFTQNSDGTWSGVLDFSGAIQYEAEDGTNFYYYILSEETPTTSTPTQQYYGIKVTVTYTAATGVATIVVSYCTLGTQDDYPYYRTSGWTGLTAYTDTDDEGDEYTYYSIPFVNTYDTITYSVDVYKYDSTTNEPLEYVTFMLWRISDGEEEAFADFTYDEGTGVNTVSAWVPAGTPLGNYNYQIVTDKEGYIHIAGLEPGEYWLEEQDPLQGYKRIEDPISFTINEDGTITSDYWSEDTQAIEVPNSEEIINVQKTDSNGDPLEGAEFVMGWVWQPTQAISTQVEGTDYYYDYLTFTEDSDTDNTYVFIPEGQVDTRDAATTLITGEDGYIHLRELVTGALYFLVETKAPDGYELLEDPIVFWVDYDGNMTLYLPQDDEHVSADGDTITVVDDAETFDVLIYKYADDGNDEPGQVISYRPKADSAETYAASYYIALAGAEFSLSRETDNGNEYVVADRIYVDGYYSYIITEWTEDKDEATTLLSDWDGYVEFKNLEAGTYTLTETKAPDGYRLLTEAIVFEVASDGRVSVVSGPAGTDSNDDGLTWITIANEEITGGFELDKTDEDGNALSGAEFILGYFWEHAESIYNVTSDNQYDYYYGILNYDDISGSYVFDWDQYSETREAATTLTTGEDGNLSITNLPLSDEYEAGFFLIETKAPTGYELLEDPIVFTVSDDGTIKIAVDNDHASMNDDGTVMTVEDTLETVDVEGSKTWESDSENKYNTRPESITINILNGEETVTSVTVTADDNWEWSVEGLPKYDSNGSEINYTISEDVVPGYTTEVSGYDVTNTLETTEVSGSKTWVDEDNANNARPDSITIYLYADGEEMEDADGNAITTTATSDDNWAWSFTDLPKYNSDGDEIEYTVLEDEVSGYIPTYDYDEDESVTITNAIPVVEKDVSDPSYGESTDDDLHQDEADNNDTLEYKMEADHIGGAHDLVLHDFLSDQLDINTLEIQSVTLYAGEGDEGTALKEGTDYTVSYGDCTADCGLEGCSFEIHVFDEDVENLSADAYVIVIFDIEVKEGVEDFDENYVDEIDNFVGLSFTAFSVRQYAEPDETETYSYGFDLYKYDADTEESLAGVEFILSKVGDDGTVYAQFEATDSTYLLTGWVDSKDEATTIVTGGDGNAVVEGLHDGTFSIEETKALEGYQKKSGTMTVTITVDEDDPLNPIITATNADVDGEEVKIENTPTEDETIEIIGSKTWDDSDDLDGIRPDSITIHLMADGEEVDSLTVTADDDWAWSFTDMPLYDDDGDEITYTITEDAVDDYDTTVDGYNVTNSHTPEEEPEPEPEPTPGPGPSEPNPTGTNNPNPTGTNNPNPTGTNNPEPTNPSKTADADLPVLPIAGCCVAFALIAAALVLRRRETNK